MKPFSKMEAIGQGKPVVCRNGSKVLEIFEVKANVQQPVLALIEGEDRIQEFNSDGKFMVDGQKSGYDLFMASTTKEGWIAFGPDMRMAPCHGVGFGTHVWDTKEEAMRLYRVANGNKEPAGTVKVSWEE